MKKNGDCKIDRCYNCKDLNAKKDGCFAMENECRKYGHKGILLDDLYSKCRLPEIKEIKVWFEKRPKEAEIFDLCVFESKSCTLPWKIEIKLGAGRGIWVHVDSEITQEDAEALLGCKIPE